MCLCEHVCVYMCMWMGWDILLPVSLSYFASAGDSNNIYIYYPSTFQQLFFQVIKSIILVTKLKLYIYI